MRGPMLSEVLESRRNSLNFLRLLLALFVVVGHAATLGGYHWQLYLGRLPLEDLAVDGFFAISGYLIAASALRTNIIRFLWQRVLRIFPGFLLCLVVVALGFGIAGWLHEHSGLSGYWGGSHGAISYMWHNADLAINHYDIAGSPLHVPYPHAWNGSMWTLRPEFECYLLVGGLAFLGLLRRKPVVIGLFTLGLLYEIAHHVDTARFGRFTSEQRFVPIFLAGALVYLYKDRIPMRWPAFAGLGIVYVAGCLGHNNLGDVFGPLLAYLLLMLGALLPFAKVGADNDLSYGIYLFAFPIDQLLSTWGVNRWGTFPYLALTFMATAGAAFLSWTLVERQALKAKKWSPLGAGRRPEWPIAPRPATAV